MYKHLNPDRQRFLPLNYASQPDQSWLVRKIESGEFTVSDLNTPDSTGQTVLHAMAERQRGVKAMLHAALNTGMDINRQDLHGQTALHLAAYNDSALVIKALIKAGALLNLQDQDGDTPFRIAYTSKRRKAFDLLLAAGADVSLPNKEGLRPIDHPIPQGAGNAWNEIQALTRQAMVEHEVMLLKEALGDPSSPVNTPARRASRRRL